MKKKPELEDGRPLPGLAATTFGLILIVFNLSMMGLALRRSPAFWLQQGALAYVLQPVCALGIYAAAILWLAKRHGPWWKTIQRIALPIGLLAAIVDITGFTFEEGLFRRPTGPSLQIGVMLTTFLLWGFAGWYAARKFHLIRAGVLASVLSAGVCAILAVTAGFLIEMFVAPLDPGNVISWGEYQRSGWTDARAFGLANTLDSGFTHLVLSLVVGAIVGSVGALVARWRAKKPAGA